MRLRLYSSSTVLLLFLFSCIDRTDYELDQLDLSPSIALPLMEGSISILDLVNDQDSAHIKVYSDGLVYLAYEQELKSQSIRELFDPPSKIINRSFIVPPATLPANNQDFRSDSIVQVVDFGMSPERLAEIALRSGRIAFTTTIIPSSSPLNYEVIVDLPDFVSRTTTLGLNAVIKGTGSLALDDYTLFLDNNKFDLKLVLVMEQHPGPVVISPGTSVNIQLDFGNFEFTYLKGFLGDQSAALDAESIDIGVFEQVFDGAEISLAQPKVSLTVGNDNGIPCKVDFKKLEGRKAGSPPLQVLLNPANPVSLAYPTVMGTSETTTVTIINVKELLDFAPTELFYQADARINEGLISGNNFLMDTSQLRVRLGIEVPLYGSASNVLLKDTLDIDLSDAELSQIISASMKLRIINEMPLDGTVQFYLADDQFVVIEALLPAGSTTILKGSTVDASGELVAPGVYENVIELEKSKIEKIFSAKHILVHAALQTSRDASGNAADVKFKSSYRLSVEAGLLANLKLSVKQ